MAKTTSLISKQMFLRTTFAVITVLAIWLGWQVHLIRERAAVIAFLNAKGTGVTTSREWQLHTGQHVKWNPIWRRWMGDESMFLLEVPRISQEFTVDRIARLFPEAQVEDLGPPTYDGEFD